MISKGGLLGDFLLLISSESDLKQQEADLRLHSTKSGTESFDPASAVHNETTLLQEDLLFNVTPEFALLETIK